MSNPVFTQWVDGDYASPYRFALSLARREAEAGDLVQQTFSIRVTKGGALGEATKAKSWLFTTLDRGFLRGAPPGCAGDGDRGFAAGGAGHRGGGGRPRGDD